MATRIRLRREGRKKLPIYRIVVADKESPRDGRFIEVIGTYDPKAATAADKVTVDAEKARALARQGRHADRHGAVAAQDRPASSAAPPRDGGRRPPSGGGRGCASRTGSRARSRCFRSPTIPERCSRRVGRSGSWIWRGEVVGGPLVVERSRAYHRRVAAQVRGGSDSRDALRALAAGSFSASRPSELAPPDGRRGLPARAGGIRGAARGRDGAGPGQRRVRAARRG